jgi:hypothetical protein
MYFNKAKNAFASVRKHITSSSNPASWEISIGLQEMSDALESELSFLRRQVTTLSREVTSLQAQLRGKSTKITP